jgi:hypothetical protein
MVKMKIIIKSDNSAFDTDCVHYEIARILRELTDRVENETDGSGKLLDSNGNSCGYWSLEIDDNDILLSNNFSSRNNP